MRAAGALSVTLKPLGPARYALLDEAETLGAEVRFNHALVGPGALGRTALR